MANATEFGRILKGLIGKCDISQEELAIELTESHQKKVSPSILSNYIKGKNIPEMDFLEKCVSRFSLKGKELKDIFEKAFFSTIQSHQRISLDTRYFREERLETLVQIIIILLLYSNRQSPPKSGTNHPLLINLFNSIKSSFDAMDNDEFLELLHPYIS